MKSESVVSFRDHDNDSGVGSKELESMPLAQERSRGSAEWGPPTAESVAKAIAEDGEGRSATGSNMSLVSSEDSYHPIPLDADAPADQRLSL